MFLAFIVQLALAVRASLASAYVTSFAKWLHSLLVFSGQASTKCDCVSRADESCLQQKSSRFTNQIVRLDQDYFSVLFFELVVIIWLIQVKDGKLLDEMAVSMTGLANKVGLAEVCHPVQTQNHFPLSLLGALAGDDVRGTPLRMPSSQRRWPRGNWFCCDILFYATLMYCHLFIFLAAIF